MKEQILKLREEGLTYREICDIVKCAKSTVNYYCNEESRIKAYERHKNNKNVPLYKRVDTFIQAKKFRNATDNFGRRKERLFGYKDVLDKFGEITECYLTGDKINLYLDDYHFDHIIPVVRGGNNTIDNLGITKPEANMAKSGLLLEELIELCKKILTKQGYIISTAN